MCCFSLPVRHVSRTRIFARSLAEGRQLLVYGMTVGINEDVAMILPIPVPTGTKEDAVRFVDLSACPKFFDELDALFPAAAPEPMDLMGDDYRAMAAPSAPLVVHEVGDFEASFVPTPGDFYRLDARFRLPDDVWDQLPRYSDHGFCVFKLRTKKRPAQFFGLWKSKVPPETLDIHPMAFEFPRRDPATLFFPTVHVHDGRVHPTADFDHELFCQTDPDWEPLMDWRRSETRAYVLTGAAPWVAAQSFVWKRVLKGELPNRDTTLVETKLAARTHVDELFRLRMCAAWEHLVDDGKTVLEPHVKRWMRVGELQRQRIRDTVSAELTTLFEDRAEAWQLAPFRHDAEELVCVKASNDRIEPQEVHVVFASPPPEGVVDALQMAVQRAFDRATSTSILPPRSVPPPP